MTIKSGNESQGKALIDLTDDFAQVEGRRPRVLVALTKSELSSQFNEVSSSLADLGFDVDISPRFQSAESLARQAAENDVHVLLVLVNKIQVNEMIDAMENELNKHFRSDILLIIKTNLITAAIENLTNDGSVAVFNAEVNTASLAEFMLNYLVENQ